ncbi:hypothetical protein MATL_G00147620 [Megalops atlanticus]|uniref:Uncharacterized protein n=1 Tax=Megalops atlanticus TaxID=7932 RepID=A0A9D3PUD4_MEGAT|nr:hypothetical protein MATL_G00147620 [Megalops atlanticus]
MREASEGQEQLRTNPLPRNNLPSSSSSRDTELLPGKKSHMLAAVLSLLKELDSRELQVVHRAAERRLRALRRQSAQAEGSDITEH